MAGTMTAENHAKQIFPLPARDIDVTPEEPLDLPEASGHVIDPQMPRLKDINLIIIGNSDAAETLLSRRRAVGGRALLLWVDKEAVQVQQDTAAGQFVWQPPLHDMISTNPDVHRLRKQYNCDFRQEVKVGPDVVDLDKDQTCQMIVDADYKPCGVRVLDASGGLIWHVSGDVVFADDADVNAFEVMVVDEDAKPFAVASYRHLAPALCWYFVQLFLIVFLSLKYEPYLVAGEWPWWRGIPMLTVSTFGTTITMLWGPGLTGVWLPRGLTALMMAIVVVPFVIWSIAPFTSVDGVGYTYSFFSKCVLSTGTYIALGMPIHTVYARFWAQASIAWKLHIAWTTWLIVSTFGSWIVMYCVALAYIAIAAESKVIAGFFLQIATGMAEQFFVSMNTKVYRSVIFKPRATGKASMVRGDQRRLADAAVAYAHSYKEATVLVSVLAGEATEPGYAWISSVLLGMLINVCARARLVSIFIGKVPYLRRIAMPSFTSVLHNQARLIYSYPCLFPPLSIAASRLAAFGTSKSVLFNNTCIAVLCTFFVFDLLEDFLVLKIPWPRYTKYFNWSHVSTFDINLVVCRDSRGEHHNRAALNFHGVRYHSFAYVLGILLPASWFGYVLVTLLLGPGFVHGMCPNPMEAGPRQLLAGLIWASPLQC